MIICAATISEMPYLTTYQHKLLTKVTRSTIYK